MSDEEDDLFADSDDDDEPPPKKAAPAPAKKAPPKKNPAAVASDSDDDLFDSDSDDDDDDDAKKKKGKAAASKSSSSKPLSKRERIEALAKKKKKDEPAPAKKPKPNKDDSKKEAGYDSGDSYDSGTFQRTKEDDDFIDRDGDDDGAAELYADDQHFDDDRPDGEDEEGGGKKKKKRKMRDYDDDEGGGRKSRGEAEEVNEEGVPLNPIMAVVHRMKKKKKEKRGLDEVEGEVRAFLTKMELAAEEDEHAVSQRQPAMAKLKMLDEVQDMLTRKDMQAALLEFNCLSVCKRWIQPLPNGKLGNVTVRSRVLESIAQIDSGGDDGIQPAHLKSSGLGKVVMVLYKHPDEVASVKRLAKTLIEQWSRPIFSKSGNMKDLSRVGRQGQGTGLAAIKRRADAEQQMQNRQEMERRQVDGGKHANLQSLIDKGRAGAADGPSSANRVRVPFSRGFAYSVQPVSKASEDPAEKGGAAAKDNRGKLAKRMLEKGRAVQKNQRSANISVEGRATKG